MEPLILVEPQSAAYAGSTSSGGLLSPQDGAATLLEGDSAAVGASSGDAKVQGGGKKRKRGPRAAEAGADADGVDGGGGGKPNKKKKIKKKAEAAAAGASAGKDATAGDGKRGAAASAKADGKAQQEEEAQQEEKGPANVEPGILSPRYAPKRQDLGADHAAIFALIKAVIKPVSCSID